MPASSGRASLGESAALQDALCLARAVSEFGATLMFAGNFAGRTQTMSLAIMAALETDLSAALALAVLLVGIAAAVLVLSRVVAGR